MFALQRKIAKTLKTSKNSIWFIYDSFNEMWTLIIEPNVGINNVELKQTHILQHVYTTQIQKYLIRKTMEKAAGEFCKSDLIFLQHG